MLSTEEQKIKAGYEPLPGYRLEEQVGQGGFGAVWRASSPGGMKKAIKFVFGNHNQSSVARELHSLDRIKGVRHPFLLTLERFGVIDDRLVIVTELADESLEDVQKRYLKNGSCGIPRDILLSHLADAADALDYLHDSYQLQHLDIKPGNLLMIGGHVKVADFGLLKDLRDVECSNVGGLTPVYAPPELFDGRPSVHSDQYSLAVMYQELLTGTRPFSGRTIAQLATQHVHSPPNLEPLPPYDRPVLAKALEKTPERRFESCRALVQALRESRNRPTTCRAQLDADPLASQINLPADVEDLPQLSGLATPGGSAAPDPESTKHALVIAIGGSGSECIQELRRRVADPANPAALKFHSALIDTDRESIHAMRMNDLSDVVPPCRLISTPLKTAHEYRRNGTTRLSSISRRWIYNVPRNGTTEGMRPLGRLALVDHGEMVVKNLQQSINDLIDQAGDRPVKVYVVGSLAGGTCSGMYIDVVHLLRDLMDKSGLADTRIQSLLATSPLMVDGRNPIPSHDTQAALVEIEHFLKAGNGYPGDQGAGWPSVPAARTPLRDLYVIAGAHDTKFGISPVETIANYVWADLGECDELLAQARKRRDDDQSGGSKPSFRSVGVVRLGDCHRLEQGLLAPALVQEVMKDWIGNPGDAAKKSPAIVHRLMRRIGLSSAHIIKQVRSFLREKEITPDAVMDRSFATDDGTSGDPAAESMGIQASTLADCGRLDWICAGWINNLYRELSVGLADRRLNMAMAIATLRLVQQQTEQIDLRVFDWSSSNADPDDRHSQAEQMFVARATKAIAAVQLEHFTSSVRFLIERLERFSMILAIAVHQCGGSRREEDPWATMPEQIAGYLPALKQKLHDLAVNAYLVRPLNDHASNVDAHFLMSEMTCQATDLVVPVIQQHNDLLVARSSMAAEQSPSPGDLTKTGPGSVAQQPVDATHSMPTPKTGLRGSALTIEDAVELARPAMLTLGGLQRLILVVSNEIERGRMESELRAIFDGPVTVAVIPGAEPKLIHEAQAIEVKNVLSRLSVLNGETQHVTAKLSSRTDIQW